MGKGGERALPVVQTGPSSACAPFPAPKAPPPPHLPARRQALHDPAMADPGPSPPPDPCPDLPVEAWVKIMNDAENGRWVRPSPLYPPALSTPSVPLCTALGAGQRRAGAPLSPPHSPNGGPITPYAFSQFIFVMNDADPVRPPPRPPPPYRNAARSHRMLSSRAGSCGSLCAPTGAPLPPRCSPSRHNTIYSPHPLIIPYEISQPPIPPYSL